MALKGYRNKEVGRLDREIAGKQKMLVAATEKFVNNDLDKFSFNVLRENTNNKPGGFIRQNRTFWKTDDAFGKYIKYRMSLLTNLGG